MYFLGLDNGGTTTKAAVFDEEGRLVAAAGTATRMLVPQPGFTERDMEEMWQANCRVTREAIEKAGISAAEIAAVAVCGHGKGLYLWGKDGAPVRNGIISTDNRAWRYPQRWAADGTEAKVFERSCQHILASQPVSLLAWLRDNEPESIEKAAYIFECKDYVRFRLTGQARAERSDYSGANLMNLHTGAYDEALLRLFALEDCMEKLPPLCSAAEVCGYVTQQAAALTGLRAGTPVAGGAFDIDACALAVGVTNEDYLCMIAGTWSINEYLRKSPVLDGSVLMNSFFCLPEYYLVEECSATSAGNNEWFIRTLLPEAAEAAKKAGGSIYDTMNDWAASIPDDELCPTFLPFLMASNVHPNALGSFVGISNYHTRAHLARSIYEGVAFSHRYHLERLLGARQAPPLGIRLAGGVARSAVWTQMFADVCGLPVQTVDASETGALGCAIIAAAAIGRYESLADAAEHMARLSAPVLPQARQQEIYRQKYQLYLDVIQALDGVWDSMRECRQTLKSGRNGQ